MKRSPLRKRRKGTSKYKAWDAFSVFIRKREADENGITSCISCGATGHWKTMDAGHFVAASISLALRFDERNVNVQCKPCNQWDHKSIHRYAIAMRQKHGPNIIEELDRDRRLGEGFKISEAGYRDLYERYSGLAEG